MASRGATALVGLLLATGLIVGAVPGVFTATARADSTTGDGAVTAAPLDSPGLDRTRLPASAPRVTVRAHRSRTGEAGIGYDVTVSGLENASALWILSPDATATRVAGTTRSDDAPGRYRWNGTASTVRATLVPGSNASTDGEMSTGGDDWAFAPVPTVVVAWRPAGSDELRRLRPFADRNRTGVDVAPAGEGVVGEDYALLGRTTVHSRATRGGTVSVVVPGDVTPRSDPAAVLDAVSTASREFDDGNGREDALVFVLPSTVRDGGATFVSSDETWINADARLRTANNVWLHEYVHSRQSFELGPEMGWFREASAEYFGGRLALDAGLASPAEHQGYLLGRSRSDAVLTDPGTWPAADVPYHRGAVVLAALDREIRERTDGERSMEDVFRRLNRYDGVVTRGVFTRVVNDVAGEDMTAWVDRHVAGSRPAPGFTATPSGGVDWIPADLAILVGLSTLGVVARRTRTLL